MRALLAKMANRIKSAAQIARGAQTMIVIFDDEENRAAELDPLTESRLRKIYEDAERLREEGGGSLVSTIVALLIGLGEDDERMM